MVAVKARFDGEKIIVPKELRGAPPGEVLVVFEPAREDDFAWLKAQEQSFAKVWDNDEDAVYDSL
jgi:hypothetical protein